MQSKFNLNVDKVEILAKHNVIKILDTVIIYFFISYKRRCFKYLKHCWALKQKRKIKSISNQWSLTRIYLKYLSLIKL